MWYWSIPSGVITVACLALPHYIHALGNYVECKGHVSYSFFFSKICSIIKFVANQSFIEEIGR